MSAREEQDVARLASKRLTSGQLAWCVLMLFVIVGSVAVAGAFIEGHLNPETGPVLRLDLDDLTPRPGFDL